MIVCLYDISSVAIIKLPVSYIESPKLNIALMVGVVDIGSKNEITRNTMHSANEGFIVIYLSKRKCSMLM